MNRIRVLVVEDSLTVRARLVEVLSADPEVEVVAEAADGKQGIELCEALRPDVMTMDLVLPVMTGLAATEYIMAHCPTPILIVSAALNRGGLFKTYDALAAGAVDVLDKPEGVEPEGSWEQRFLSTVKLVSRIRVITHLRARRAAAGWPFTGAAASAPMPLAVPAPPALAPAQRPTRLIAIGASTGGPGALVAVLSRLKADTRAPVLLVLHINEPFGNAFADWLDAQVPRPVAYARDGDAVSAWTGRVAIAPPGRHLSVKHGRLHLTHEAERHSCRPSVDVLFESVAQDFGSAAIGCLLTGMGRDGASGLLAMRQAGGLTVAQDEATSVIYGMPREAALLGAATHILPLPEIGPALSALATREVSS
jgi:two-component system chemotaxis response regulator CheB